MSLHAPTHWLLSYDIACPRRLARVFAALKKEGIPLQYSVFLLRCSQAQMGALIARLSGLIDPRQDDVRAYHIPARTWHASLGQAILPADVWQDPQAPDLRNPEP